MKKNVLFRIALLLLAAAVLCACLPAAAEEAAAAATEETPAAAMPGIDDYVPGRYDSTEFSTGSYKLKFGSDAREYEVYYANGALQQVEVELEDIDGAEYEVLYDRKGKVVYAEYEEGDGQIFFDGSVWRDEEGAEVDGPDLAFVKKYYEAYKKCKGYYPDNTMCVSGLSLRDYYPNLTDKWYHILPVDLTQEGTTRYPLVVSNMYYLGYCEVAIQGGNVTVDYFIPNGDIIPERNCMAWFTSMDEITRGFLDNPASDFRYGKPVSIQDDLKGQEIALLFICNRVSYRVPYKPERGVPVRYFETTKEGIAYREQLSKMMFRLRQK